MKRLVDIFRAHNRRYVVKWAHYFPAYERHFSAWRDRKVTFLEIGVGGGGSLEMWREYFGPQSQIVGVDINGVRKFAEPGIEVRIGDQKDAGFLRSVVDEFGPPDIVLDDGIHRGEYQSASFNFLYPLMPEASAYMVEDLQCSYWSNKGGGLDTPTSFVSVSKRLIDQLNAEWTGGLVKPDNFTRETYSMSFYPGIVVFEKGVAPVRKEVCAGDINYGKRNT